MIRKALACLSLLAALAGSAVADPVLTLEGLPATFTPGGTFTFDVALQDATNLNAFDVTVVLESTTGIAGTDFFFLDPADDHSDLPSLARYVFGAIDPADQFYNDNISIIPASRTELNLSGALFTGEVSTVAGANDLIARVSVRTSASFTGTLSISIDSSAVFLLTETGDDIPGTLTIEPGSGNPSQVAIVPEPATMGLVLLGGLANLTTVAVLKTRTRHRAA